MKSHCRSSPTVWLAKVLALATAYCIAGRLGLLLAISPGYATVVWPASGIALGSVLLFGNRLWPGVWLGSFLVNLWVSFDKSGTAEIANAAVMAGVIGFGAVLEAVGGALLIRRFVRMPNPLDQPADIIKFLVLGGPVGALIGATWGVTMLLLGGVIPAIAYSYSWWTWWVGDVIGVLIFTPLVLTGFARPRDLWRRRRYSVAIPLCMIFAVAIAVVGYVSEHDEIERKSLFEKRARAIASTMELHLVRYTEVLDSIERFFASSRHVDRDEFHTFVSHAIESHPGIQALEWIPRVRQADRSAYELAARQDGYPNFQFRQRHANGQLVTATPRSDYFPVYYAYPLAGNENAIGYDVGSNLTRLEALDLARDSGMAVATAPITLVQETAQQPGFLIFQPIYRNGLPHGTKTQRRENLQGFAAGVFRIGDMIEASLKNMDWEEIGLWVYDDLAPMDERLLYVNAAEDASGLTQEQFDAEKHPSSDGIVWSRTLEIGGRRWAVLFAPTAQYLGAHRNWYTWAISASGLLLTGLLGAFLLLVTGRAAAIQTLVVRRTGELSQANKKLKNEFRERAEVEKKVRESEERFNRAVHGTSDGLWDWDITTNEVWYAPRFKELLEYEEQEFPHSFESFETHLHPDDREATFKAIQLHLEEDRPYDVDYRLRTKHGEYRWFRARGQVVRDAAGVPIRMAGSIQDTTSQKLAEQELGRFAGSLWRAKQEIQKSQERFELAVAGTSDGLWDWMDVNKDEQWWSPRFYELLGYEDGQTEASMSQLERFMHFDDVGDVRQAIRVHFEHDTPLDMECRLRTKRGDYHWIRLRGRAKRDAAGQPNRMAGSITDITEHKRSAERIRQVVESAPSGMVMVDQNGRIILVNKQTEMLFGYKRDELMGQPIEVLVPHRFRAEHPQRLSEFFSKPKSRAMGAGRDLYGCRKDGGEFPVEIGLNPIETDDGLMVLSSIVDITERKRSEEELRSFMAKIQQSNEQLVEFARVASHDLQEPLRKVQAFADRLKGKYADQLPDGARDYIDHMQNATVRMQHLIKDLLSYSRVTTVTKAFVPVGLSQVVEQVVSDLEIRIQETDGRVDVDDLPTIEADPTQMGQLLQNLIGNALKYRHPERSPLVRISAEAVDNGQHWRLVVVDNGIGFDNKYVDRIFAVFQRLHGRDAYEGTGVGLAICKKIVERHGGSINATSIIGQGSTFTVTLPAKQHQIAPASHAA